MQTYLDQLKGSDQLFVALDSPSKELALLKKESKQLVHEF
jgi:hypothetical protein